MFRLHRTHFGGRIAGGMVEKISGACCAFLQTSVGEAEIVNRPVISGERVRAPDISLFEIVERCFTRKVLGTWREVRRVAFGSFFILGWLGISFALGRKN